MENIVLLSPEENFTNFMSLPEGTYKNIVYNKEIRGHTFKEANIAKDGGKTYYSVSSFQVMKNKGAYYVKRTHKDGFTLNEKGKVSVWFGKTIFNLPHLILVCKYFNMNWFSTQLMPYITKSIFEKMLSGKLTNNSDIMKAYVKINRLDVSPKKFLDTVMDKQWTKSDLLRHFSVAKDQNHVLDWFTKKDEDNKGYLRSHTMNDLIDQAGILGRKIDFKWSEKRINEEHKLWTREIMAEELKMMEDIRPEWIEKYKPFSISGFRLMESQKEIFEEGTYMDHCVYTNYWSSIKNGSYLVYHLTKGDEEATLGLNLYADKITFNQCYRKRNELISDELQKDVESFIKHLNNKAAIAGYIKPKNELHHTITNSEDTNFQEVNYEVHV